MCYRFEKDPQLKSHKRIVTLSEKWKSLSAVQQKKMHEDRTDEGFKRPSLLRHWQKFDMVEGFAQDVMHQMDEGLAKSFLKAIVDNDGVMGLKKAQVNEIDRRWIAIIVPGHDNRKLRSIRTYKQWKAHELRFFLQHGGPFVTKGVVPKHFHKILCLASSIAWTCTKDAVSSSDISTVEEWSRVFLIEFQKHFGVQAMKYSVHLVQHIPLALRLFGPLHLVSCYRPENEIGKISRRICGTNNTTKQIMESFLTLTECGNYLHDVTTPKSNRDSLVVKTAHQVMNLPMPVFSSTAGEGICRLSGKPEILTNDDELKILRRRPELQGNNHTRWYSFKKARLENGINVRTSAHNEKSARNESVVLDCQQTAWKVLDIVAVLNEEKSQVERTYVYAEKLTRVEDHGVFHIYPIQASGSTRIIPTSTLRKHLVILHQDDCRQRLTVSQPSNIYLVT